MCCIYKDCNARVFVGVIRNCTEAIIFVQPVLVLTETSRIHLLRILAVVSNSLLQWGSHWLFVRFQGEMGATGPVAWVTGSVVFGKFWNSGEMGLAGECNVFYDPVFSRYRQSLLFLSLLSVPQTGHNNPTLFGCLAPKFTHAIPLQSTKNTSSHLPSQATLPCAQLRRVMLLIFALTWIHCHALGNQVLWGGGVYMMAVENLLLDISENWITPSTSKSCNWFHFSEG